LVSADQDAHERYRVIVLDRSGAHVLLVPDGQHHILPWVELPRWQRVAENLTVAVRREWGEEILGLLELPTANASPKYLAAEHLRTRCDSKMSTRWVPVSALTQESLIESRDYAAIEEVSKLCKGDIEGACAGTFVRLGWFYELRNWIDSVIEPIGFHLTGEFRQLNASPTFSLVRFETDGPALWFKAVGEPNLREFAITCTLAQLLSDSLPPMLAVRPEWNGWLSWDVRGELLSEVEEQALWERAAAALARLQIESIDRGSQMLGAGAHDLITTVLSELIEPFLNSIAQLMDRQSKVPPAALNHTELLTLADFLKSAIDALGAAGIPDTLGHLDLNPGNIIVSKDRCTFLDWAEAYVGNPLFSLEYLVQHAGRAFREGSDLRTRMTAAYCAQWEGVVSHGAIGEALALAPLVAIFAYAAGNDLWKQPTELQDPAKAGYLRSLTRRMHREAKQLADRRTLCLQ
jgi:Phosphotransferase enzyme family